ncbi:MAG: hypothetical protein ACRDIB_13185, partial [Ardenticatenaceae bacterium]
LLTTDCEDFVDLPFFGSDGAPPSVRRPQFVVQVSDAGAEEWAEALVSVRVEMGLAPAVDAVTLHVANEARAPGVAVGDEGTVELGYEDSGAELVFTGTVAGVRHSLAGSTRVTLLNGSGRLARLRVNQSFRQQKAGEIVEELVGQVGMSGDRIEDGIEYPFYVVDSGRSVYGHIGLLAARNGFLAYVTPEDRLDFRPIVAEEAEHTFTYGVDIVAFHLADATPVNGRVTLTGEGAAGSNGVEAWSWLVKEPASVQHTAGSDDPARRRSEPSLRSGAAVEEGAAGLLATQTLTNQTGVLHLPGAPSVRAGSVVAVAEASQESLDGLYLVRHLRHRYDKRGGFGTRLYVSKAGEGGFRILDFGL